MDIGGTEIFTFLKQIGLAVSGASALWGFVFLMLARRHPIAGEPNVLNTWIAIRLLFPFSIAAIVAFIGWIGLSQFLVVVEAHEGIVIVPEAFEVGRALGVTQFVWVGWLVTLCAMFILWWKLQWRKMFFRVLPYFLVSQFLIILFLISLPAYDGWHDLNRQLFFIGHGFHSIFTLGTVIVLDVLFLSAQSHPLLRSHLYPIFPVISAVIWTGLGFDFISVALVFEEALRLTPKFFFMQTVIGIIIVNGALLSGWLTRKLQHSIEPSGEPLGKKWERIADISGTISICSWLTITFVDFLEQLPFTYFEWAGLYIGFILCAYVAHHIWLRFQPTPEFVA